jgi:hypothetical protein
MPSQWVPYEIQSYGLYRFKPVAAPLSTPSIHRQIDSLAFFTGVGTIAMELEMVAAAERFQGRNSWQTGAKS